MDKQGTDTLGSTFFPASSLIETDENGYDLSYTYGTLYRELLCFQTTIAQHYRDNVKKANKSGLTWAGTSSRSTYRDQRSGTYQKRKTPQVLAMDSQSRIMEGQRQMQMDSKERGSSKDSSRSRCDVIFHAESKLVLDDRANCISCRPLNFNQKLGSVSINVHPGGNKHNKCRRGQSSSPTAVSIMWPTISLTRGLQLR